ncbi:MAG: restriction endonuclease subunit S [candidate division NC10 bacterium]|nr:restriction endonuclease subunit S [candidate division NC10 bacterium]MDE2322948.1 restriction endonuclease subunit S [candidate division NC10 bacterium]
MTSSELNPLAPWEGQLPTDWDRCRLDAVADVLFSNVDKHTLDEETPVRLCNYVDVYKNGRITDTIDFMEASAEPREISKFQIVRGDVLVTKDSETPDDIAIAAMVAQELPGVLCGYHLALIRPRSRRVSGTFLYWLHASKAFRAQYEAKAVGVTRWGLSQHAFRELLIPLPPLPEQERIAAYLDASCAAIDAAVSAKRRQLETLDAILQASLHRAFANEGWPRERVKDLASKIGSGVTPEGGATGYLSEGIPLLRSQNIHFDGMRLDDVAFISEETHAEMSNSQLKPRDVLLNITGASIGRCTFVPENFGEGNVNQHVCIIRGNHKIDHRFLAAFLSSPMGQGQVLSSFTGASRQGLSHKELGLINIPLPSIGVQRSVVAEIERQRSQQKQVRDHIGSQIDVLVAYRKSLIHECVTGQRRSTETATSDMMLP